VGRARQRARGGDECALRGEEIGRDHGVVGGRVALGQCEDAARQLLDASSNGRELGDVGRGGGRIVGHGRQQPRKRRDGSTEVRPELPWPWLPWLDTMLTRQDLRGGRLDPDALRARDVSDAEAGTVAAVREIVAEVRTRGDAALRELTARFDGARIEEL